MSNSSVGNDGPLWGSILNPADQSDVISVGGWGGNERIAEFSSRGMTTSEISSAGMGRIKPDVLAPSVLVHSSGPKSPYQCRSLSGTSVATPVVTGVIVAMLSQAFEPYDSHQNLRVTQSDQQSLGTNINSTQQSYISNLRGREKESKNGNLTAWTNSETFYDRKSPKFLRMKNVAAMKQIINHSAKPLKPLGQNLRIYWDFH